MAAATIASLPPSSMTMPTTHILIALAFALPWTRIRWHGGGCTVMHLIHCCHGSCCWRQLCLHLWDNGTKDNGHGDKRGHHADICGQKRWDNTTPLAWSNQNKNKIKNKTNTKSTTCRQCHHLCTCRQPCLCCHCCCLCISRGYSGSSTGVGVAAAAAER
jgi:hypothetical protein